MGYDNVFGPSIKLEKSILSGSIYSNQKKKRKTLTSGQRLYIWEHPKKYGRTCSICGDKIKLQSDLELDHTRAHSKGGTKMALAHKQCNKLKGSGSLGKIHKALGIKTKRVKRKSPKKRIIRHSNPFGIQQIKIPKLRF